MISSILKTTWVFSFRFCSTVLLNMSQSLAMVAKKSDSYFDSYNSLIELDSFSICYFERKEVAQDYAASFGNAEVYPITHLKQFFDQVASDSIRFDAYLTSAERASALTIQYSGYRVVNPLPYHINNALVFPIAHSVIWKKYIDNWIDFRVQDGTINRIYSQWILGQEYKKKKRAWSIYDDVIMPKYFNNNTGVNEHLDTISLLKDSIK